MLLCSTRWCVRDFHRSTSPVSVLFSASRISLLAVSSRTEACIGLISASKRRTCRSKDPHQETMEPAGWRCSSECFCWRKDLIQRTLFPHGDHLSISFPHRDHLSVYFIPTWRSFICVFQCISSPPPPPPTPRQDHLSVYFSVCHSSPEIICLCILVHFIPTHAHTQSCAHTHTHTHKHTYPHPLTFASISCCSDCILVFSSLSILLLSCSRFTVSTFRISSMCWDIV